MNILLFTIFLLGLTSINSTQDIPHKSIIEVNSTEINDLVYKISNTRIELTKYSCIIINYIPSKYDDISIEIYSYNDNTQKAINYNGNIMYYNIEKNGLYDIFAIIKNNNKLEKVNLIPYITIETDYNISNSETDYSIFYEKLVD